MLTNRPIRACLGGALLSAAGCSAHGAAEPVDAVLADWMDRLTLEVEVTKNADGALVANVDLIGPRGGGSGIAFKGNATSSEPCPRFTLTATINGEEVEVHTPSGNCPWPRITGFVFAPDVVRARQTLFFAEGDDGLSFSDVVTRFDVQLTDASGTFGYDFARELPVELRGELISERSPPQVGDRVEVRLSPAPQHVSLGYLGDIPRSYWVLPPDERDRYGWERLGEWSMLQDVQQGDASFSFVLPELNRDSIDLFLWPWTERPECPFLRCATQSEHLGTGIFVGLRLPLASAHSE